MSELFRTPTLLILFALLAAKPCFAAPKQVCVYADKRGKVIQTTALSRIPTDYRSTARCFAEGENQYLAKPEEINLEGAVRREDMSSPIGRIELRWPRKIESLFGRTPLRAMADAARTVSRATSKGSFPQHIQNMNVSWKVVFLDADLPETQIPAMLISNCHPGWMTPPANIYIVGQRVAGGCSGNKVSSGVADTELAQVLVHEMGHALEAQLLGGSTNPERMWAEGFATWFEQYAAGFSSILNENQIRKRELELARESYKQQPSGFQFSGTAFDYARASLPFLAVTEKRGIDSLMKIYQNMGGNHVPFMSALQQETQWSQDQLSKEISALLSKR